MAAVLSSIRSILHRTDEFGESGQWFRSADHETGAINRQVYVDHGTWEDLGRPNMITVMIKPGAVLSAGD